jgi:hypothetical protein
MTEAKMTALEIARKLKRTLGSVYTRKHRLVGKGQVTDD